MRPISLAGLQSLCAETTASVWCPAITLSGAGLAAPFRVISNTVDVNYGANTYLAMPFQLVLARDTEDAPTQAKFIVDNIDRSIAVAIRSANGQPQAVLEIFRIDENGTVVQEMGPESYVMLGATVDANRVECVIGFNMDVLNESAVADRFTPAVSPALFK